jgi:AcrR family transcriptional regulator
MTEATDQHDAENPPQRSRNRAATRDAILAAAKAQLADHGFAAFGMNAVARRAQCDKQLVYRYFGGLDGLIDAIGDDLATWVSDRLSAGGDLPHADTYGQRLDQILQRYIMALRADPLMQRIIAWEASENAPHVRRLADARSRALMIWVAKMRGSLVPPPDLDAPALNAILVAAIQHLVLCGTATGQFLGVPLVTDADWLRMQTMVTRLIRAMHD